MSPVNARSGASICSIPRHELVYRRTQGSRFRVSPTRRRVVYLQSKGYDAEFGKAISTAEEEELSKLYQSPFWIVGIPRAVELSHVIDSNDTRVTMVADLIASNGYGELLGIAEKIHDPAMLDERLDEKASSGNRAINSFRRTRSWLRATLRSAWDSNG